MEPRNEQQISPVILQAIFAQAAAHGVSVNEYLARFLGLPHEDVDELSLTDQERLSTPNPAVLDALARITTRQANRPFTKSSDTVSMLREARAGMMWDYEPTE